MLLRLAALGALGYVGYKYLQKNGGLASLAPAASPGGSGDTGSARQATSGNEEPDLSDPHVAMAGGPLSNDAAVVHAGQLPAI